MNWKEKLLQTAELIDAFRTVPRLILIGYSYLTWDVVQWYMALENPTSQHGALVVAVVGVIAPIAGFYQSTGRKWDKAKE